MHPALLDAVLTPTDFSALEGWAEDDLHAAFACFRKTALAEIGVPESAAHKGALSHLRPAHYRDADLIPVYRQALEEDPSTVDARAFFERHFVPHRVEPDKGRGFLTGYYEPEVEGSLEKTPVFSVPVLARPDDLFTFPQDEPFPLEGYSAGRRTASGYALYPERAAIWDGALDGRGLELLYLKDRVELFFVHIQGSARVRLPDGTVSRLTYAGRNGHPYTTIAKQMVAEGLMALEAITLETLKHWLRSHPDHAERLMRLNRSYIFFSRSDLNSPGEGPIGAASTPLVAGRSIAVDRRQWSYGLPFFIAAVLPSHYGAPEKWARLMVAQDTGSAILGAARADLFMGSGEEAGHRAGLIRHPGDFTVLLPRG
jgi:membrane-bound lytic murein transglycosylase A